MAYKGYPTYDDWAKAEGTNKRGAALKRQAAARAKTPDISGRKPEYKTEPGKTTITVRGGKEAPAKPAPKPASKPASKRSKPKDKPAAKASKGSSLADWARGEQKRLRKDQEAQKHVQASVKDQAKTRAGKRDKLRTLGRAVKPSKSGYESYKRFMGG